MHHGYGVIGRQGPAVKQHCLKYTHKTLDLNRINHISTNRKSLYEAGFFCCHGTDETYGATAGSGARVSSAVQEREFQASRSGSASLKRRAGARVSNERFQCRTVIRLLDDFRHQFAIHHPMLVIDNNHRAGKQSFQWTGSHSHAEIPAELR